MENEKESAEISERESDGWRESADARIFYNRRDLNVLKT